MRERARGVGRDVLPCQSAQVSSRTTAWRVVIRLELIPLIPRSDLCDLRMHIRKRKRLPIVHPNRKAEAATGCVEETVPRQHLVSRDALGDRVEDGVRERVHSDTHPSNVDNELVAEAVSLLIRPELVACQARSLDLDHAQLELTGIGVERPFELTKCEVRRAADDGELFGSRLIEPRHLLISTCRNKESDAHQAGERE